MSIFVTEGGIEVRRLTFDEEVVVAMGAVGDDYFFAFVCAIVSPSGGTIMLKG